MSYAPTSGPTGAFEGRRAGAPAAEATDRPSLAGAALAELLGTFMLLFFGVGAVSAVVNFQGTTDVAGLVGIALGFGLAILAAIYAFGHVSGAHLNPAVTLSFLATRKTPATAAAVYIVAQLVGAVLGVLAVQAVFEAATEGVTRPGTGVGTGQALLGEFILGFVLVLVVHGTAVDDRSEGPSAGLAIGLVIAAGHLALVPVTGASFNPARSFGSAIVAGDFGDLWIYVVGPVAGALVAALLYERLLRHARPPEVDDLPG
jgi:MIP family channel proteins